MKFGAVGRYLGTGAGPFGYASLSAKWLSLLFFIAQHAAVNVALRYSTVHENPSRPHIASTVVWLTELMKLVFSLVICYVVDANCNLTTFVTLLDKGFVTEGMDVLKLCVPAVLYTIQNNLQYVIETAPLFLVMYQMKIITTAMFYSILLNRRMKKREWACVIALVLGIGIVQSSGYEAIHIHHASNIIGVLSVITACITSGFAGVYFEKILKASKSSIWMINVQLSLLSSAISMFACLIEDTEEISRKGFFGGYNGCVMLVIVLQAGAGLVVALVVKYADNVFKGFATSLSIVLSGILDSYLFRIDLNEVFAYGSVIVVMSSGAFLLASRDREWGASFSSHLPGSHSSHPMLSMALGNGKASSATGSGPTSPISSTSSSSLSSASASSSSSSSGATAMNMQMHSSTRLDTLSHSFIPFHSSSLDQIAGAHGSDDDIDVAASRTGGVDDV